MLLSLLLGAGLGFAAAVQPGPFTAYLVARTLAAGWRRTLPAIFAPLVSDGPIALLALLALSQVPPALVQALRVLGGVFVLWLAHGAWRAWRSGDPVAASTAGGAGRGVLQAAGVNFLNPGPWLGWTLVMGPLVLRQWREGPTHGLAVVAGFYAAMFAALAGIIVLFHQARRAGARIGRALVGISALALAGFGVYQLWLGIGALLAKSVN
jgi:threonine/homoserine/homoserine lactone efflux protein